MAVILSRPRLITIPDCTIQRPFDCDFPDDPLSTIPRIVDEAPYCSTTTSHLFCYDLAHKLHDMLSLRTNMSQDKEHIMTGDPETCRTKTLHREVRSLIEALPAVLHPDHPDTSWDIQKPHLPFHRRMIQSSTACFFLYLHRAQASTNILCRQHAIRAALDMLRGQEEVFVNMKEYYYKMYGLSFCSIDSAIFLSSITIEHPPDDHTHLENVCFELDRAIDRLTIIGKRNLMAKSGAQILTQCHQRLKDTLEKSPITVGGKDAAGIFSEYINGVEANEVPWEGQLEFPVSNSRGFPFPLDGLFRESSECPKSLETFGYSLLLQISSRVGNADSPSLQAVQYPPQPIFDTYPVAGQAFQPDMFMYSTGFDAAAFESVGLPGDIDLDPSLYLDGLNWDTS